MRYLGLDYGDRLLGVALGEGQLVTPLTSLNSKNWKTAATGISKLASTNRISKIVLGLPLGQSKELSSQAVQVKKFANFLEKEVKLPVILVNEVNSSQEALDRSLELDQSSPKNRRHLDSLAAAIILERYLLHLEKEISKSAVKS